MQQVRQVEHWACWRETSEWTMWNWRRRHIHHWLGQLWTMVQQHGIHTPIKTSQSWKPSTQCCKIYNKKLWENARNCNWTVETAGVWTTTRQKKATETVHVIQHCQRTGGSATQGHSESGTAKNSWKSLLKSWHYESRHWHFEILVFSTKYTGL